MNTPACNHTTNMNAPIPSRVLVEIRPEDMTNTAPRNKAIRAKKEFLLELQKRTNNVDAELKGLEAMVRDVQAKIQEIEAKLMDADDDSGDLAETNHTHLHYLALALEVTASRIEIAETVANWIGDVEEVFQGHCRDGTDDNRTIARLLKTLRDTGREVQETNELREKQLAAQQAAAGAMVTRHEDNHDVEENKFQVGDFVLTKKEKK
ncbi:hypothetical protein BG005_007423 [Podila minutissima]|nr:hypothetical protein BG005_007423 [Podila minutissima]